MTDHVKKVANGTAGTILELCIKSGGEILEFDEKQSLRNGENIGVRYPVNNTGYSAEKLCPELIVCAEARESAEIFDKYCSGNYSECKYKVLT